MADPDIPPEHIYCVKAGKKHYDLFTTIYAGENYCGCCGLSNPFQSQRRARSRTPALPGLYNEVIEVEDSPPHPVSPASQLMRDRFKLVSSSGIGYTQLIPDAVSVHISLLLVSLEIRYFNSLAIEIPETVLPLKDTPSFTQILFNHLRPLPSTINPTNKELWSLSYASSFSGKKIVTIPNINKYITPSSMLASGHFSNNQAGQLKMLIVLTSADVVDKQEPITPLRPDEYSTSVRKDKKQKVKKEKVKQENTIPASSYLNLAFDEGSKIVDNIVVKGDTTDLSDFEDPVDGPVFDSASDEEGDEREAGKEYEIDRGNETSVLTEFVRNPAKISPSEILISADKPGVGSHPGIYRMSSNTTI
ncbi:hypothetical protein BKA56DRAFT_638371 [Ilyonectria sp. MPI-CAGE-AT-0026]|nr:hypothetical protein BKA56DRAFT_638371 [Ilyonectria sp. MPI-CAGE-AT-0026]